MSSAVGRKKDKMCLLVLFYVFHLILTTAVKHSGHCCYFIVEETEAYGV